MKSLLLAGFAGALIVGAACGGNVVVDGAGGTGGAGPTTNSSVSSSSSSVTTSSSMSTSSGPSCSCGGFCGVLQGCKLSGVECPSYCDDTDPQTMQCACNSAPMGCDAVSQCFGSSTGPGPSTTVGVGGSGGGNGTPSIECFNCIDSAGNCGMEFGACNNNPECEAIVGCHDMLGWTYEAVGQCDGLFPGGYDDYYAVVSCAVCETCFNECAMSSLATYCFDG